MRPGPRKPLLLLIVQPVTVTFAVELLVAKMVKPPPVLPLIVELVTVAVRFPLWLPVREMPLLLPLMVDPVTVTLALLPVSVEETAMAPELFPLIMQFVTVRLAVAPLSARAKMAP